MTLVSPGWQRAEAEAPMLRGKSKTARKESEMKDQQDKWGPLVQLAIIQTEMRRAGGIFIPLEIPVAPVRRRAPAEAD
jgi:hypothetical protein